MDSRVGKVEWHTKTKISALCNELRCNLTLKFSTYSSNFSRETHGYEYSVVDAKARTMEMISVNLTFCNFVSMRERMKYSPHPEDPQNKTILTSEMIVTVRNVPLTTYMESIILNTVSNNANKGREAMDWVVQKFEKETRSLSDYLDKLNLDVIDLKDLVADNVITRAQISIEELQQKVRPKLLLAEQKSTCL